MTSTGKNSALDDVCKINKNNPIHTGLSITFGQVW